MISDVDLRDWDFKIKDAREAVDNMDDYARMTVGLDPIGARTVLENFIDVVEKMVSKQKKQTAALFLPKKE